MTTTPAIPISGSTALTGVLGDPVRHSLSPAMHNAALRALGLNWIYLALPVGAAELAGVLRALEALDCRGLNVTLPHKRAAAQLAAELCPLAERLGAVNTLVRRQEGGWLGTNTDVEGFMAPLRASDWRGKRALVLGGGGSALAVLAGLEHLGFAAVAVAGRDPGKLAALAAGCQGWLPQLQTLRWSGAGNAGWVGSPAEVAETGGNGHRQALEDALERADLVVNTTPVGMASAADPLAATRCPLDAALLARLRPEAAVYDLIYTPRPTVLLQAARERGCHCLDGLDMLVRQGAASLSLWSGRQDLPVEAMREAALTQLKAP